jgi:hypothetical protein
VEDATAAYDLESLYSINHLVEKSAAAFEVDEEEPESMYICHSGLSSGYHRRRDLITRFYQVADVEDYENQIDMTVVYNDSDQSCFIMDLTPTDAMNLDLVDDAAEDHIQIQPLSSYMKLRASTLSLAEEMHGDVSQHKTLALSVCPSAYSRSEVSLEFGSDMLDITASTVGAAIDRVRNEYSEAGDPTRRLQNSSKKLFLWADQNRVDAGSTTLSEALSSHPSHTRRLDRWKGHFQRGLSAEHSCSSLFDEIEIEVQDREVVVLQLGHGTTDDMSSAISSSCILSFLAAMTVQPEICSAEVLPMSSAFNDKAQWILQSGTTNDRPWFDAGLTGSGQIIQVSDSGLDTNNCYFWDSSPGELRDGTIQSSRRKVIQYVPYQDDSDYSNGHGTHVVGSILGRRSNNGVNESQGVADGTAMNAKVAFFDIGNGTACCYVPGSNTLFPPGYSAGAKIHSASWGARTAAYNSNSRGFDSFSYSNKDFLSLVAAGNSGTAASSVGAPATAKNIISVGASQSNGRDIAGSMQGEDYLAYFSSRGPTSDGRTKPDIVSPGFYLLSARAQPSQAGECDPSGSIPGVGGTSLSSTGLSYKAGTSMATPAASGTAALVREYFEKGFYPLGVPVSSNAMMPSASLVKAVLLNGAVSLLGDQTSSGILPIAYYDQKQNFGRINLKKSLPLSGVTDFVAEVQNDKNISAGAEDTYQFNIDMTQCSSEFSATLVWTDPAASSGCSKCLINDLDLTVLKNSVLNYANGKSSLDTLNNAERVRLSTANGDLMTVKVTATNLATSSQEYSLVVTGCIGTAKPIEFPSASPSSSDHPSSSPVAAPSSNPTVSLRPTTVKPLELITTYNANYKSYGAMFDLVAKTPIEVSELDLHIHVKGTYTAEVYAKKTLGTYYPDRSNASAWNMVAKSSQVEGKGYGQASPLPSSAFTDFVKILPGNKQAFYVTLTQGEILYLAVGGAVGEVYRQNDHLQFLKGSAKTYPFASTFSPRVWNGTIKYRMYTPSTDAPTSTPISVPTLKPSLPPTLERPSASPSASPVESPTSSPSSTPTISPSSTPTVSLAPTPDKPKELVSTFATNNGSSGNMFDLVAKKAIEVKELDVHSAYTSTYTAKVYIKSTLGTYMGVDKNSSAWTEIGSASVSGKGAGKRTPLPVNMFDPVKILTGNKQAFYVTFTSWGMRYTNGYGSVGEVYTQDDNLQLLKGSGKAYPFGGTYTIRIWNGAIRYSLFNVVPTESPTSSPSLSNRPSLSPSVSLAPTPDKPKELQTTYSSNNGQAGNMFDLVAKSDIIVTSFDIHTNTKSSFNAEVYAKKSTGTYWGDRQNAAAWNLIGSGSVSGQGYGARTQLPPNMISSVSISRGNMQAFYITLTTANIRYTNGSAQGTVYKEDTNLQVLNGSGKSYKFGGTFTVRVWNGVVYYRLDSSASPSTTPSKAPISISDSPSTEPSISARPSFVPSSMPSISSAPSSSSAPSASPVAQASSAPSAVPSESPVAQASSAPSSVPSKSPVAQASSAPSSVPSESPVARASSAPSSVPSKSPVAQASSVPSSVPSESPVARARTSAPSSAPSVKPVAARPSRTNMRGRM